MLCNGLGLQAALEAKAFTLEVTSLKDKIEREIGVSGKVFLS